MSFISGIRGRKSSKSNAHETVPVDIWEPFEGLTSFASLIPVSTEFTSLVSAPLDWKETPEAHVFMADLPGVKKEEMKVEVEEEKVLKVSGQRSRQNEEKSKWHRSSEKFLRTVRLPPDVDVEKVKAVLDHGVLTVTLPKEQEKKAHGRLIPIL